MASKRTYDKVHSIDNPEVTNPKSSIIDNIVEQAPENKSGLNSDKDVLDYNLDDLI